MDNDVMRQAAMRHKDEIMPPYDVIMDMDGFEAICAFCDMLGGSTVYVPNKRTVFMRCLEMEALEAYNGFNHKELTRRFGFSESHLRRLIKREL